jgi:hypothetical protein
MQEDRPFRNRHPESEAIEPVPIEDRLCTRLLRIDDVGGWGARFVLVHDEPIYELGGQIVPVIKDKIILPYLWVPPGIEMAGAFMTRRAISIAGRHLLRLVK